MGNVFTSSIGRKLIMSITGAFLVLFLFFHMAMNLVVIISPEAYDLVCYFLGANWYALVGTMILAAAVVLHFVYAIILTLRNLKARGRIRYAETAREEGVSWASKNMFVLGTIVILGLLLHLYNFWYNMQWAEIGGHEVNSFGFGAADGAALVYYTFSHPVYVVIYLVWFAALWFHLTHGMWSMMHTVGFDSKVWEVRLKRLAYVLTTLLMLGFAAVVVVTYLKTL